MDCIVISRMQGRVILDLCTPEGGLYLMCSTIDSNETQESYHA